MSFSMSNPNSIIIIAAAFVLCLIIGYFGDKRFKAKHILEKKTEVKTEANERRNN